MIKIAMSIILVIVLSVIMLQSFYLVDMPTFDSPLPPAPPPCNEFYNCVPTPDPFISPLAVEQPEQTKRESGVDSRVSQDDLERGMCLATARHYGVPESVCK